jgi:glutamine amidotransferase
MFVLIIDYGSGNIKSVYNSVKRTLHNFNKFSEVKVSRNLSEIKKADKIILPGVGSFDQCMNRIRKIKDLVETLKDQVITKKKPFLGICVGMQILADYGYENKKTKGLSWINGDVKPLKIFLDNSQKLKIPHMGWNSLSIYKNNNLLNDITANDQFYFVHSYFFDIKQKKNIICNTQYGINIPAIVNKDNIFGFQFHPEKSGSSGLKILYNWLKLS